jgi:hypothetical protein
MSKRPQLRREIEDLRRQLAVLREGRVSSTFDDLAARLNAVVAAAKDRCAAGGEQPLVAVDEAFAADLQRILELAS